MVSTRTGIEHLPTVFGLFAKELRTPSVRVSALFPSSRMAPYTFRHKSTTLLLSEVRT